jgi:ribose 5-phosphate isomerase RpiB
MWDGMRQDDSRPIDAAEIDEIVRRVVARLHGRASAENAHEPGERNTGYDAAGERRLWERVIAVETLNGQTEGLTRLAVARGTVITPAAKDFLRERGIAVRYVDEELPRGSASPTAVLLVGVSECDFEPGRLVARLRERRIRVEQLARVGLVGVVDEMVERVRRGSERGLLFCGEPDAAVCLANRAAGIRAARAGCPSGTRRVMRAVGANLLVVDPAGKSIQQIEQAALEFCSATCRCPGKYRERLG